jgi:hypothetical protein
VELVKLDAQPKTELHYLNGRAYFLPKQLQSPSPVKLQPNSKGEFADLLPNFARPLLLKETLKEYTTLDYEAKAM